VHGWAVRRSNDTGEVREASAPSLLAPRWYPVEEPTL